MKYLWLKLSCACAALFAVVLLALIVAWFMAVLYLRNNCLEYGNSPDECRDLTINPFVFEVQNEPEPIETPESD